MKRILLYTVCGLTMITMFNSCHIYNKYHRPDVNVEGLFRDTVAAGDTLAADSLNMGDLPWEEVFTDTILQRLIRIGLEKNSDLQTAMLQVEAANASFKAARLAFLPTLNLTPQGGVSSFDGSKGTWTYSAPVTASWEIDLFGRILNSKRNAKAVLMQSEAYKQAVRTQIISAIANGYYTLLMLDEQLAITEATAQTWNKSVETIKAMKIGGMANEAAVAQSEANSYMIAASVPALRQQIREAENSLSTLLYQAPQAIERGKFADQKLPEVIHAGVPVQLLSNRPDVQSAELSLAAAYYTTNIARSAFYPNLVISGSKAAKAQQEMAAINFQQTILNAGAEVSNALYQIQTSKETLANRELQVASLERAVESTESLMKLGTSTYLEVLTAQQSLLNAQLSQISDSYQCMVAVVSLYHALGGGREIEENTK